MVRVRNQTSLDTVQRLFHPPMMALALATSPISENPCTKVLKVMMSGEHCILRISLKAPKAAVMLPE